METPAGEAQALKQEFIRESGRLNRSPVEREQALRHIDAILDEFWEVTIDLAWESHASGES